jgi:hypothetical protein
MSYSLELCVGANMLEIFLENVTTALEYAAISYPQLQDNVLHQREAKYHY